MSRRKGKPGKKKYMRLVRVQTMLIDGFSPQEIVDILSAEFKVTARSIQLLIIEVKKAWRDAAVDNPAEMKMKYIDRMDRLYRLAVESKQYATAAKIQDVINKMIGLYEREQTEDVGPAVITISGRSTPMHSLPPASSESIDVTETLTKDGTKG